ncbi:decaprenyl-phosphate phosphoribosyltransferase [bacterium]|nr:MAG: decaprenyl-phosphate phosphoribosyltransferase [bacterium]
MSTAMAFVENMRPRQWTKNLLLFAGVIFAQRLGESACVTRAVLGVLVFCCASGVIYIFNDIADIDLDRRHPTKRLRPIASERLPLPVAVRGGLALLVVVLAAAALLGPAFLGAVSVFFLWNWLYTRVLKKVPVLDVSGIGMSFVIRATAGVFVLLPACPGVTISPWLLLCTFFLSLFLGFAKRRDELLKVAPRGDETRPALKGYTEAALNAGIGVSFGLTGMAYALYTVWPDTVAHFGTRSLIYTLPFVLAGMGRYLYLVYKEERGGKPHEILLNDAVLQVVVVGWVLVSIRIIGL